MIQTVAKLSETEKKIKEMMRCVYKQIRSFPYITHKTLRKYPVSYGSYMSPSAIWFHLLCCRCVDTSYQSYRYRSFAAQMGIWQNQWWWWFSMMTSSNGNIFRVTGPLCEEFTGHRRIPLTKASDAELSCFLWYVPDKTVEPTQQGRH